ncbi:hypothetical protein [Desulfosporosinus sp. FKB]|uniref:hypothetical protein n=1 Tax=Desulfosporosinus sp. FKB TaxID=1969835 RepID=UPI001FA8FC64|nr:hypothetical protein [Desulfosporosinus sp. FKB]
MKRKRITQLFPFLLPFRRTQRKLFFYIKKEGKTYEQVSVCQQKIDIKSKQVISENLLYTDVCEVGYPLQEETVMN